MMTFEGMEEFAHAPDDLFVKLADVEWLSRALPDAEVLECTPDRAQWKVKPKFAFMSGTLDTSADVLERVSGELVRYRLVSKGVGSSSTVIANLRFSSREGMGTMVNWTGEMTELGGLLKLVPQPMLHSTVKKVIQELWIAIRTKL
jgi:uncharacterized protein